MPERSIEDRMAALEQRAARIEERLNNYKRIQRAMAIGVATGLGEDGDPTVHEIVCEHTD